MHRRAESRLNFLDMLLVLGYLCMLIVYWQHQTR